MSFFSKNTCYRVDLLIAIRTKRQIHVRSMLSKAVVLLLFFLLLAFLAKAQTCQGVLSANLISTGDFGSGPELVVPANPFLAPAYTYQNSTPPAEGAYTLAKRSYDAMPGLCWANATDSSADPNGYFMLVHANTAASIIYERTIEVCDDMEYELGLDLINLASAACPDAPVPDIDLLVNGQVVHSIGALTADESWHAFHTILAVGSGTDLLVFSIRNNALGAVGIDNVRLQHCAPAIDLPPITQVCNEEAVLTIDPTNITYPNPYYQWQHSFDGGNSWEDIPGAGENFHTIDNPINGLQYRILVANGPVNYQNPGCRASSSPTTIELVTPVTIYQTPTICSGDTLQIGGQSLSSPGSYTLPLGGSSGCDTLLEVLLFNNPTYDQLYNQQLCAGDSFLGQVFTSDTLLQFNYLTTAGCDSIIHYEVDVLEAPATSINGATTICMGTNTQWTAPSGFASYQWSTGSTEAVISLTEAGTYGLTVQNSQGCTYALSQTLSLSNPIFEFETTDTSCPDVADGQIQLLFQDGGVPPYQFQLNEVEALPTSGFSELAPGYYEISMIDALGCTSQQTTFIAEAPTATISLQGIPSGVIEAGDTLFLAAISSAAVTYNWRGDGIALCSGCAETPWIALPGGQVQVEARTDQHCLLRADTLLEVLDPYRVYKPNAFSPNQDGQNDLFQLGLGSNVHEVELFEIYDRWGALVYAQPNGATPQLTAWDGTKAGMAVPEGVYLYRASVRFQNGKTKQLAGDILLIR